ncbi:MAG TPA: hypothetical protein DCQ26_01575 [Marinilabiliales bacterium]|nr:MAG: hypothetical protein A2W84_02720 [Bacteroidetes bacterium GWC2_40_13]OFX75317.1 MAG: hypothetical protein A2W96_13920 [Bacteroidetes bacterium GWD2_40_43]OFX88603.1 MAG: hypothetical protein A2W97_01040 [Bacteroidetes bacterium GWE2_40_63]OFY20017.1 MAG: hypothetical protein A2W88_08615 [Bacteroidetes bacterium GWF2_40_13]OFZ24080.1 MAG: hypothetical protein A2437_11075 [Bacteroidetes bacterium RIFOXYC2_FULL_40_12]HAM97273.1 hypothetical protein [Marinilabiliales bacterium]
MKVISTVDEVFSLPGKRIAFFGGSFDPPHFGHLDFIRKAAVMQKLDHIIVCPHSHNPEKKVAEIEHRLRMMDLIFETNTETNIFALSPIVCHGIQNQLFIDDILYLLRRRKKEVYVLLGCDSLEHCSAMFQSLDVTFIIGCRVTRSEVEKRMLSQNCKCIFIDDMFHCSSTRIKGEPQIRDIYLSPEVVSYIEQNHLYWSQQGCEDCN